MCAVRTMRYNKTRQGYGLGFRSGPTLKVAGYFLLEALLS